MFSQCQPARSTQRDSVFSQCQPARSTQRDSVFSQCQPARYTQRDSVIIHSTQKIILNRMIEKGNFPPKQGHSAPDTPFIDVAKPH